MKKIIVFFIAFNVCISSFCQVQKKEHILQSKRQAKAGFILAGAGAAVSIAGLLIINNEKKNTDESRKFFLTGLGVYVIIVGVSAIATSIPFFVSAHKEHRKAMAFSIKNETLPLFQKGRFTSQIYPALALRISLSH